MGDHQFKIHEKVMISQSDSSSTTLQVVEDKPKEEKKDDGIRG